MKDWWDADSGYEYIEECECWHYWEDSVLVLGRLYTPSQQLVAQGLVEGLRSAEIGFGPFRPWQPEWWYTVANHYLETDWYDQYGYYYWTDTLWLANSEGVEYVWCTAPTGETTFSDGWADDVGRATMHRFRGVLAPSYISFNGRTVTEQEPPGAHDTCWFPGSIVDQFHLTGGSWSVGADNAWAHDLVGWLPEAVEYYRGERVRLGLAFPCEARVPQQMIISCGNADPPIYQQHDLYMILSVDSVAVERAGVRRDRLWP